MTTDTMQMNTRISRALKESGDAALARAGYSPSQAVRKLWSFAASNTHNPRAIQNLLEAEDEEAQSEAEEERTRRRKISFEGANIVRKGYEKLGIKPSEFTMNASYDELREYALLERLRERGLDA